jgi:hypothetical protein
MDLFQSEILWTCFRARYYGLVPEQNTMDLFQIEILWTCSRAKHYGLVLEQNTMDLFQSKSKTRDPPDPGQLLLVTHEAKLPSIHDELQNQA